MAVAARLWLILAALAGLLASCNAPHDNPLDPESDRYGGLAPTPADVSCLARSVHISRNGLSDTYSVIAEFRGPDAALMDSVIVAYDGLAAVDLSRTGPSEWATLFTSGYFGDSRLGVVIGNPFYFTAFEGSARHECGPAFMWRVIEGVPVLTSPSNEDTVGAAPTLQWESFSGSFPFGFQATISLISVGFETTVWTSPLLPSSALATQPTDSLADGEYYWTITVVDSFENSSRSKEGAFVVVGSAF